MEKSENKPEKKLKVSIVKTTGKSTIVEYRDKSGVQRVVVPTENVQDEMPVSVLEMCTLYGVPWAEFKFEQFTPAMLNDALHNANIWTFNDLQTKPKVVIGVLQSLYQLHLGKLALFASELEKFESEVKNG